MFANHKIYNTGKLALHVAVCMTSYVITYRFLVQSTNKCWVTIICDIVREGIQQIWKKTIQHECW